MSEGIDPVNPLGIRSLSSTLAQTQVDKIKEIIWRDLTWDWIFSSALEKIIVAGCIIWTMSCIGWWIWHLF
jgi:hypothetical protein